jgi:Protein of unknown function (DUF3990)
LVWQNDNLVLYHGCTDQSLRYSNPNGIQTGAAAHGIDLSACARHTDFGQGFYATSWLKQAKNWANLKARQLATSRGTTATAIVLSFEMDRNHLANLEALAFTTENSGYWPFVIYCRNGSTPHARAKSAQDRYDIVYGPVSLFNQELIIKDSDQVSFHTQGAILKIPLLSIVAKGSPLF